MRIPVLILTFFLLPLFSFGQSIDLIMQAWYWDYYQGGNFGNWVNTLNSKGQELADAGFKHIWLPPLPRTSTSNNQSNGYNPKDLYDFGETYGGGDCAWGSRTELNALVSNYNSKGLNVVSDVVFNHRDGGKPEKNTAVKYYITSPSASTPYPSDRFYCVLPLGSANPGNNGAGVYNIKVKSKAANNTYGPYQYKFYAKTKLSSGYAGQVSESEPNGGGDCGQPTNAYTLTQDVVATLWDYSGCHTDEFTITLNAGQFNATDDTLFIYLTNYQSGYSDHYVYGIWSAPRAKDIVNELEYWTYTGFNNLPSGQGLGNYNDFRPNDNTANAGGVTESLGCDWNCPLFFYDYDQDQTSTVNLLNAWAKWQIQSVGIKGLRMDAVKHFDPAFVSQLLDYLYDEGAVPQLVVGESFDFDAGVLASWVNNVEAGMSSGALGAMKVRAFDFALRGALKNACDQFGYDVRNVFNSGMVDGAGANGYNVVTFINNHDLRNPGEPVQNDPMLAYAYILTNNQVGAPCIFYPDYYGVTVPNAPTNTLKTKIDALVNVHESYIYGSPEIDYLSRMGTPYAQIFNSGYATTTLVYQLKPANTGDPNVIVAINFAGESLDLYQDINTGWGATAGSVFNDVIGNAGGGNTTITNNNEIHVLLPARSYTVYVQNMTPMPVELVGFTARAEGARVALRWNTAMEKNVARYELERATGEGQKFEYINYLPAENSPAGSSYSLYDEKAPTNTPLFYRLKMIDTDGSFKYSPVRQVTLKGAGFYAELSPNPAKEMVQIKVRVNEAQAFDLTATNILGQTVRHFQYTLERGDQVLSLDISTWPKGSYQIALSSNGTQQVMRLAHN